MVGTQHAATSRLTNGLRRLELLQQVSTERQKRQETRRHSRIRSARYYSEHKDDIARRRKLKRDAERTQLNELPDLDRERILAARRARQREYARKYREKRGLD
ncbi:hypothetical protein PM082_013317 [Marasmius tenuissimus]|nr:hypothetical protein PM082_013317 [Marasmius tenuissimus]